MKNRYSTKKIIVFLISLEVFISSACFSNEPMAPFDISQKNIEKYYRKISTVSPEAREDFNQGMIQFHAFNYDESYALFTKAIKADPNCAMCYWGSGLTVMTSPNVAKKDEMVGMYYVQQALKLSSKNNVEHDYAEALLKGYEPQNRQKPQPRKLAFAMAMGNLAKKYLNDLDASVLYVTALMDLSRAKYDPFGSTEEDGYSPFWKKDGSQKKYTREIISTLDRVLTLNPYDPGALHYYIHVLEASPKPEQAMTAANRLNELAKTHYKYGHFAHVTNDRKLIHANG